MDRLRRCQPPVIGRLEADNVIFDPRTVLEDQDQELIAAIRIVTRKLLKRIFHDMKTDLDALMQEKDLDAILITGPAQHNPAMVYMTGGGHVSSADLIKRRGHAARAVL